MFPQHIDRVLDQFGVGRETKVALHQLYLSMGEDVLEAFADLATATGGRVRDIGPAELDGLKWEVVRRFLGRNHPAWLEGRATQSFYRPRDLEGQAAGVTIPLEQIGGDPSLRSSGIDDRVRTIVGPDQPVPSGIVTVTHHGHYCGRQGTISFDVVAPDLDTAIAVGLAEGRQHTVPGSVGETTGSWDSIGRIAVLWEVQPNVLKPSGGRNATIGRVYRRHRNWHVTTMVAAIDWLAQREAVIYVLRGAALRSTHQVNPEAVLSTEIQQLHERTVARVARGMGYELVDPSEAEGRGIADASLLNVGAGSFIRDHGAAAALWKLER